MWRNACRGDRLTIQALNSDLEKVFKFPYANVFRLSIVAISGGGQRLSVAVLKKSPENEELEKQPRCPGAGFSFQTHRLLNRVRLLEDLTDKLQDCPMERVADN